MKSSNMELPTSGPRHRGLGDAVIDGGDVIVEALEDGAAPDMPLLADLLQDVEALMPCSLEMTTAGPRLQDLDKKRAPWASEPSTAGPRPAGHVGGARVSSHAHVAAAGGRGRRQRGRKACAFADDATCFRVCLISYFL